MAPEQRIIGIDPGLRATGFGIIVISDTLANPLGIQYLTSGTIRPNPAQPLPERLSVLFHSLCDIIKSHHITEAAIEKTFINQNPQTSLLLGQARGVAIAALTSNNMTVHEYTALQIKQANVGYGHAQKKQIQWMVQRSLKLDKLPSHDAADALACAICHNRNRTSLRPTISDQ